MAFEYPNTARQERMTRSDNPKSETSVAPHADHSGEFVSGRAGSEPAANYGEAAALLGVPSIDDELAPLTPDAGSAAQGSGSPGPVSLVKGSTAP